MRAFATLAFLAIALTQSALCAGKAIPFDEIFLSVRIGRSFGAEAKESKLKFSVRMERGRENPEGSTLIEAKCPGFEKEPDTMAEEDVNAFLEVAKAAKEFREMEIEVKTDLPQGKVDTVYKVVSERGKRFVRVYRGDETVDFSPKNIARAIDEGAEAAATKAWYETLLAADVIPEMTPEARAPRSDFFFFRSTSGYVQCGGIVYSSGVAASGFPKVTFSTTPGLLFYSRDGRIPKGSGNDLMKALFKDIVLAADAAANGKVIVLRGKGDHLIDYWVRSNVGTKKADITVNSPLFTTGGSIGQPELAEIQRLKRESEERIEWLRKNESLFFTPFPEKKGSLSIFD
jgi:hypothetical protein